MIDALQGRVVAVRTDSLALDVNGIVFLLFMPQVLMFTPGENAFVFVHVHWNQETGPQLFGFIDLEERLLFSLLLSVSGIGPRLALAILRDLERAVVVDAILRGDSGTLSSVSGLGRKKAEALILALKDKIQASLDSGLLGLVGVQTRTIAEATKALEALGYARAEIKGAVDVVCKSAQENKKELQVHEILKAALQVLSKRVN